MRKSPSHYDSDAEPTHLIPKELADKLVEAKKWYNERRELEETIARVGGIAERNQADRDDSDSHGALILAEVVETIEETWGFAPAR